MREPPPTNARLWVNFQDNIARADKSMTPLQFAAPITADCGFVIRRLTSSTSPIRATELPKLAAAACASTGRTVLNTGVSPPPYDFVQDSPSKLAKRSQPGLPQNMGLRSGTCDGLSSRPVGSSSSSGALASSPSAAGGATSGIGDGDGGAPC